MFLTSKSEIKEIIVSILSVGGLNSIDLQKSVEKIKKVTKQGFYKALRELTQEEIIVKNKQLVLLSNVWINKLHDFANNVDTSYQLQAYDSFLNLEEGDSLIYRFKSISNLDALWMHYFFLIAKKESNEPLVIYNLHEFWSLSRTTTEGLMYKWIINNKRKAYILIGGTSKLDRTTTQYVRDMGISIGYEKTPWINKNVYRTVIGDYVIDTVFDWNTINAIEKMYKENTVWNQSLKKDLDEIISRVKRSKVVIERNKKKAEQFKKRVLKYFVVYM